VYEDFDDFFCDNPSINSDRKYCDFLPSCITERAIGDYVHRLREYKEKDSVNCNKQGNGKHKDLLPGILVVKCIHGITLGNQSLHISFLLICTTHCRYKADGDS
jgi:hypothetical protein